MICKHVYYSGHVQGVGFRFTAVRIANRYKVTGYVRNMYEGLVEMVVEGSADKVGSFMNALDEAMKGHISDTEIRDQQYTGSFDNFGVRF